MLCNDIKLTRDRFHSCRSNTLRGQIHLSKFWENEMHNAQFKSDWRVTGGFAGQSLVTFLLLKKCIWACKVYLTSECIWPMEFRFHEARSFLGKSVFDLRVYLTSDCETCLRIHMIPLPCRVTRSWRFYLLSYLAEKSSDGGCSRTQAAAKIRHAHVHPYYSGFALEMTVEKEFSGIYHSSAWGGMIMIWHAVYIHYRNAECHQGNQPTNGLPQRT